MTEECNNCDYEKKLWNDAPCVDCSIRTKHSYWEPKPQKGIDIEMTCGESHHIDTEQPSIETIKLNGEQVYPATEDEKTSNIKTHRDMAKLISKLTGRNWVFDGHGTKDYWEGKGKRTHNNKTLWNHFVIPWSDGFAGGYSRYILRP